MKQNTMIVIIGIVLLILLQYNLWFSKNGLWSSHHLTQQMSALKQKNEQLTGKNNQLKADIQALKKDPNVIAEKARENFGMIKPGETYYHIVGDDQSTPASGNSHHDGNV
jgi:cell division protein FtsB